MVEPRSSRKKAAPAKRSGGGVFSRLTKKPMRILALVVIAGVLVGIGLNATLFQTARHPAPLFAGAPGAPVKPATAQQAAPQALAALAPRRAEPVTTAVPAPAPRPVTAQQAARPPAAPAREATDAAAKKNDPIAALLRSSDSAPTPTLAAQSSNAPTANAKIVAAQRALQKVGFVVKPDGVFSPATRQALEKFESDRSLPITGKLAGRTLKELSAQSGIAIQ